MKTGNQENFAGIKNIGKIMVFFSGRAKFRKQTFKQNRPTPCAELALGWKTGFRENLAEIENTGKIMVFSFRPKYSETGFEAKSAQNVSHNRTKSENWLSGKFCRNLKHMQNERFFIHVMSRRTVCERGHGGNAVWE